MEKIKALAEKYWKQAVSLRHYFHQYPELSGKEFKTAEKISELLDMLQISYYKVTGTGLVAVIRGELDSHKCVALRADMDALPIQETNELPYKSKHDGIMHACGHDVHMASLLGTLMIVNDLKSQFGGFIKIIFQPSEEEYFGGAETMIEADVLKNPDVHLIFGQHVSPEIATGSIGIRAGTYMASCDEVYLIITGKGGHAALGSEVINPLKVGVHILSEIEVQIKNKQPATSPSVIAFGKFVADGKCNVICDVAKIEGTIRTFDETWREQAHLIIKETAERIAKSYNAHVLVDIRRGYPVLYNNQIATDHIRQCAIQYLGNDKVVNLPLRMTADDFAFFLQKVPGCYYRLGVTSIGNHTPQLHSSNFDIDETALKTGMGLMAWIAIKALQDPIF